jgi:AmmeMemoRadiSam system protein B
VKYQIRRVFILGPSHHAHLSKCSISPFDTLETPLGELLVDSTVRSELLATNCFTLAAPDIDTEEHSIEMHLPFLAQAMAGVAPGSFTVIPIIIDGFPPAELTRAAQELCKYTEDPGTLFIVSR